jgi:protein-S-isoprenylcysteine O-methyltransferase Ste14
MTKSKKRANIKISAPTLAIIHITMAILLGWLAPLPIPAPPGVQWLGLGLAAIGFILGVLSLIEFRRSRASKKPGKVLITTGIYNYTRNPVYLGFLLMLIGIPLDLGIYWGFILVWPFITMTNNMIIKHEETYLQQEFKDQYLEYSSRVKRWLWF